MKNTTISYPNIKSQIVIPKDMREATGMLPGIPVRLTVSGNKIILEKLETSTDIPVEKNLGVDEVLNMTRGTWGQATKEEQKRENEQTVLEKAAARKAGKTW